MKKDENYEASVTSIEDEQELSNDKLHADSPSELLAQIGEATALYTDLLSEYHDQFVFDGKSLSDWSKDMKIEIPNNVDPQGLRKVLKDLSDKTQRASSYYSLSVSMYKAFSSGSDLNKSSLVAGLVAQYQERNARRPSADVIQRMADSYMKNSVSTKVASLIVKDFWHQKLEALDKVRKIVEQIGMSLHVEMKHVAQ